MSRRRSGSSDMGPMLAQAALRDELLTAVGRKKDRPAVSVVGRQGAWSGRAYGITHASGLPSAFVSFGK